jgi:hypothetical protein
LVHPFFGAIPETKFIIPEGLEVPRLGMVVVPSFEFLTPGDELRIGEGVGESEGDEISAAVLFPMGKVAASFVDRGIGAERKEG